MTKHHVSFFLTFLLLLCGQLVAQEEEELPGLEYIWHDPEKIVTSTKCGECHASELAVWEETKHATGFYTMHRKESAQRIQEAMGFKLIKRESLCLKCHYTAYIEDEQVRAAEGVSCESCHGAGRDWIDIHNNYGPGNTYETEPPEHKEKRIAESVANGMKRPSQIYEVVASCFRCHTVPHEELVNKGGHTTGSTNFELVSRIDKIRHNFLQAQFDPTKTENRESSPERKRLLYVTGKAADLEYSIRGAAKATENAGYIRAMQRRVRTGVIQLSGIHATVNIPQIQRILNLVGDVNIGPNREAELLTVADKIEQQIRAFVEEHDGTQLAELDPFVSGEKTPTAPAPATTSAAEPSTPESATETSPTATPSSDEPAAATTASTDRPSQPAYPKKQHIRPRSQHDTIGPSCNCHRDQNDWWATDRHNQSVQPFLDRASRNVQIARLYGINPDDMAKGNQLCMDCHGTVVTGQEAFEVFDGVSCESCHGPAGDYKEPHSSENPPNGYPVGKEHGMVLLENAQTRAEACAQCHYITDPRLISTGHPTGNTFNFVSANQKINHWKEPTLPRRDLRDAFEQVKQNRGGIPDVEQITAAPSRSTSSSASTASRSTSSTPEPEAPSVAPEPPKPRPAPARAVAPRKKNIDLPPFPDISDSTTVEETLLLLKQRLELIHKKLGSN